VRKGADYYACITEFFDQENICSTSAVESLRPESIGTPPLTQSPIATYILYGYADEPATIAGAEIALYI